MASRVGWRCSHPSCRRLTVGPKQGDVDGFHLAGRAAHITAAAVGGPRYDVTLSPTERRHHRNGLWLCTLHASIVDTDELNYSVATLQQWRSLAEHRAHSELTDEPFDQPEPHTLVAFGFDVVVEAIWRGGDPDLFVFDVASFVEGDLARLRTFIHTEASTAASSFITVESQGDGRLIRGPMTWEQVGSFTRVRVGGLRQFTIEL